ncbi:MAG: tRNA (adenosine(37)-N6)-dimethylallyltransferase MiaA [Candidatus Moranbacteria bacterium]|nr:tRNA (adenosine(37)-N6)-dimethylallyltransferase MiaA [Candidatus Moranbacteria bacterium]
MNYSDSERITSFLESHQLKPAKEIGQANLVIFNTCGVRQMAEDRVYGQIHNLSRKYEVESRKPKIIVTGCLANRKDVQTRLRNKVVLFTSISDFPNKLMEIINKEKPNASYLLPTTSAKEQIAYLSIKPKNTNGFSAYVPIMTGCNNFCSYCVVPYARGREVSRPAEEIIEEVKSLVKRGYKHIILLGQNVNSYSCKSEILNPKSETNLKSENKNSKKEIRFSGLLKKINRIPGKFWISFISNHPKDVTDEMIETVTRCKKVCENFHLPVQAGNDEILKRMNRHYTKKEYLALIRKIRSAFKKNKPGAPFAITSDIILGFPGETSRQFLDSAEVMEKSGFDMVYFGQFSPRPGTAAWNMKDDVSKKEKSRREKFLNEMLKKSALKNSRKFLGGTVEVLIEKEKDGFYYGKTRTLKNVRVHPVKSRQRRVAIGEFNRVKITKANVWNLEACLPERQNKIHEKRSSPSRVKCKNLIRNRPASVRKDKNNKNDSSNNKIIVIAGPTASGKSDIAIKLAKKFRGEIISADSRQIYRGMDIGSGKIARDFPSPNSKSKIQNSKFNSQIFMSEGIPHYMIDIVSPNTDYSAAKFKKRSIKQIGDILSRGKLPIICGGTGFWIKSIVDNITYPEVKPDKKLRKRLEKETLDELFKKLKKLDPERAKVIDSKNKVRLIRAIEICKAIGKVPKQVTRGKGQGTKKFQFLQIAIDWPKEELKKRIRIRLDQRLREGMVAEVKRLHAKDKVSWKRLYDFGLEYRWVSLYLRGKISKDEMREKLYYDIVHYAKRQRTWFKKDPLMKWFILKPKDSIYKKIEAEVKNFIEK